MIDKKWDATNYEMVREFHAATGLTLDKWPPTEQDLFLRGSLLMEEFHELDDQLMSDPLNKEQIAKELADCLYVVYGTAATFGIDLDTVFGQVHESNMSKLVAGKPVVREDGKIMKGPNYVAPDLSWISR
jgi:predicted HAD superfamily Cof-like phosphohydrolase